LPFASPHPVFGSKKAVAPAPLPRTRARTRLPRKIAHHPRSVFPAITEIVSAFSQPRLFPPAFLFRLLQLTANPSASRRTSFKTRAVRPRVVQPTTSVSTPRQLALRLKKIRGVHRRRFSNLPLLRGATKRPPSLPAPKPGRLHTANALGHNCPSSACLFFYSASACLWPLNSRHP